MKMLLPFLGLLAASAAPAQTPPLNDDVNTNNVVTYQQQQQRNNDQLQLTNQQNIQTADRSNEAMAQYHRPLPLGQSIKTEAAAVPLKGQCTSKRSPSMGRTVPGVCIFGGPKAKTP